jgi:hypothetical protein
MQMPTIWRMVLAAIVRWYAMDTAMLYGGIWASQAKPTRDVDVMLANGQHLTGLLMRDWQKLWVISTADGTEVRFVDFQMSAFYLTREQVAAWLPTLQQFVETRDISNQAEIT